MSEINLKNNLAALTGLIFRNDKLCDNLATWHLQTGRNLINLRTRRSCTIYLEQPSLLLLRIILLLFITKCAMTNTQSDLWSCSMINMWEYFKAALLCLLLFLGTCPYFIPRINIRYVAIFSQGIEYPAQQPADHFSFLTVTIDNHTHQQYKLKIINSHDPARQFLESNTHQVFAVKGF